MIHSSARCVSIECGLSIKNFNDIKVGDNVEAFEMVEVKRTLEG